MGPSRISIMSMSSVTALVPVILEKILTRQWTAACAIDKQRQDLLIAVREGFYHDCQQRTELIDPVGRHDHRRAEACTRNLERGIGLEAVADAIEIPTQPGRIHLAK